MRSHRALATEYHMLIACPLLSFAVAATFLPLCGWLVLAGNFAFDAVAVAKVADSFADLFAGVASFLANCSTVYQHLRRWLRPMLGLDSMDPCFEF